MPWAGALSGAVAQHIEVLNKYMYILLINCPKSKEGALSVLSFVK